MIVITKSYHELIIFSRVHKQTILTGLPSPLAPWWFCLLKEAILKDLIMKNVPFMDQKTGCLLVRDLEHVA